MRYAQKMVCLLVLVLAASFGIGGCVLLYSDFAVQRSRAASSDAAAHAQACTLLQTEIIDLQRRGVSVGDAALTARVEAQQRPAALWRGIPSSAPRCRGWRTSRWRMPPPSPCVPRAQSTPSTPATCRAGCGSSLPTTAPSCTAAAAPR